MLEVLTEAAADYLDMSEDDLVAELRGGNSLADIAEDEDESVSGLIDALVQAVEDELDEAVDDGKISDDQRDAIVDKLDEWITALVHHEFGGEHHRRGRARAMVRGVLLEAAADYLDLSEDEVVNRLRDGDSLADIADDEDESVQGLVNALVDAAEEALDDAVDDGRISDAQRDEIVDHLAEWIGKLVQRSD